MLLEQLVRMIAESGIQRIEFARRRDVGTHFKKPLLAGWLVLRGHAQRNCCESPRQGRHRDEEKAFAHGVSSRSRSVRLCYSRPKLYFGLSTLKSTADSPALSFSSR